MRLTKMFGLAALAAFAAMAFLGASSASATFSTALCKLDKPLVCASPYTGHIEGTAVKPELLSSITNVTCEKSHILGNALGLATAPARQVTHLELISFTGNCKTSSGTACTVTTKALGLVHLLKTAANLGVATSLGSKVQVVCGFFINCTFGGEPELHALGATLPLSGTSLATLVANKAVLSREGGICPATAEWDATYTIQLPHDLYIQS